MQMDCPLTVKYLDGQNMARKGFFQGMEELKCQAMLFSVWEKQAEGSIDY